MDKVEILKKYKDLLDNGVISQEEFDAKEKEIFELSEDSSVFNSLLKEAKDKNSAIKEKTEIKIEEPKKQAEENQNKAEENNQIKEKKDRKRSLSKNSTKAILIAACVLAVFLIAFFAYIQPKVIKPMKEYNTAIDLLERGHYRDAKVIFTNLGDYKDAKEQVNNCEIAFADDLVSDGKYKTALDIYNRYSGNPKVTSDKIEKCKEGIYQEGIALYKKKNYESAKEKFKEVEDYSDSSEYIDKCENEINKVKEEAKKKEEERKAAEEAKKKEEEARKAAGLYSDGRINGTLDEIMEAYLSEYDKITGRVENTLAIGSVNLIKKDNSYGGKISCSADSNITIVFTGYDANGENEIDANKVPNKIAAISTRSTEGEGLACSIVAFGNLLRTLNPQIDPMDATDAVLTAIDNGSSSIGGIDIQGASTSDYLFITVK